MQAELGNPLPGHELELEQSSPLLAGLLDQTALQWTSKREGEELPSVGTKHARLDGDPGEIKIPQQFVGWLKGKGGGQIREIEAKSGAQVSIDQSTKELGYSRVLLAGSTNAVQIASDIISNELRRVMDRDGLSTAAAPGDQSTETHIPQKYVGWLKGSGGSQIHDMELRSGAHVRIDQSTREMGYSVAQISGTPDAVRMCKELIEAEVTRVQERDRVVTEHTQRPGFQHSSFNELQIPQQYVGWIKGSGGGQIKAIEQRTGAHVTIDQSTQELGYSRAMVYGTDIAVQAAKQFITSELARVMDRDKLPELESGALQSAASATQINPTAKDALSNIVALLVAAGSNPEQLPTLANALSLTGSCSSATPTPAPKPTDPADTGEWDYVRIPNSCVGWLKGRQGAMIREIESKSGAQVDINQTTKDMGYSTAQMRGSLQQKKIAHGLVIAEVTKVMDQSGEPLDGNFPGSKSEFRIDAQYVGWVKGPRGKVVQDIQVKSGTRIDVDQSTPDLGYATVKVFGTLSGTQQARALIAAELSKISPEAAAQIVGDLPGGLETAQQVARQAAAQFVHPTASMFPFANQQALANEQANQLAFAASSPSNVSNALAAVCGGANDLYNQQLQAQQIQAQQLALQTAHQQAALGEQAAFLQQAAAYQPQLAFLASPPSGQEMQQCAIDATGQFQNFMSFTQPSLEQQIAQAQAQIQAPTQEEPSLQDLIGQFTQPGALEGQLAFEEQAPPPQLNPPTELVPGQLAGIGGQRQQPDPHAAAAALQLIASLQQLASAVNQAAQVQSRG